MQKKLIVLAIAAAMSVPAMAQAEVTVYGQMNMSVDMVKDGNQAASGSSNQLNSNSSRLGIKTTEDLGNGLTAVVQLEGAVAGDTGNTTTGQLFNRNTYLGLNTASGNVQVGNLDTPYKSSTRKLDLFMDGIADNRGNQSTGGGAFAASIFNGMGGGHDARLKNSLAYTSPSFSGLTVAAATVFGAEGAVNGTVKGSMTSLAGMYEQGAIYATLALQTIKVGDALSGDLAADTLNTAKFGGLNTTAVPEQWAAGDKSKAMKLGGSYTMDKFAVNAVIEKLTHTVVAFGGGDAKRTNIYLGAKFKISDTDAVKAAVTKQGEYTDSTDTGSKQFSLGYDHSLSKRSSVYALYTKLSPAATGAAKPSALSVGMKHAF